MHPHMLRHTFVTTMLDAGVDLRDLQIAARHAGPRTTTRYDRARKPRPPPQLHPRRPPGVWHKTDDETRCPAELRTLLDQPTLADRSCATGSSYSTPH